MTAPILHTINAEFNDNFSFQTYVEAMKKKEHSNLLNRKMVLGALALFDSEYPISMSMDNENFYLLKDWMISE